MIDDERKIREMVEAWMAASRDGDVAATLDLMTDDVVFLTPGQPPFGKEEFAVRMSRMRNMKIEGRADIQEIVIFGDHAYLRNNLQITLTQPGQAPRRMAGSTMGLLRRDADGRWRLARDANLVAPVNA